MEINSFFKQESSFLFNKLFEKFLSDTRIEHTLPLDSSNLMMLCDSIVKLEDKSVQNSKKRSRDLKHISKSNKREKLTKTSSFKIYENKRFCCQEKGCSRSYYARTDLRIHQQSHKHFNAVSQFSKRFPFTTLSEIALD